MAIRLVVRAVVIVVLFMSLASGLGAGQDFGEVSAGSANELNSEPVDVYIFPRVAAPGVNAIVNWRVNLGEVTETGI